MVELRLNGRESANRFGLHDGPRSSRRPFADWLSEVPQVRQHSTVSNAMVGTALAPCLAATAVSLPILRAAVLAGAVAGATYQTARASSSVLKPWHATRRTSSPCAPLPCAAA